MNIRILPFIAVTTVSGLAEKPFLHPLFTDHMVLQRGVEAPIWGWTEPGKEVLVTLGHRMGRAVADKEGKWMVKLGPYNASGPFEMTVKGPQEAKLQNVMIGDVWICSGQSNMEWAVRQCANPDQEIAAANYPNIRLFTVPKRVAFSPQDLVEGKWDVCSPATVPDFSAVGYFFGRDLHERQNVAIGLIDSSWGGTICEAWASAEALNDMADFRDAVAKIQEWDEQTRTGGVGETLSAWFKANDPGSGAAPWSSPEANSSNWSVMNLPSYWEDAGLKDHDGVVWFRKVFSLPDEWMGRSLTFTLGAVDDFETVWVNGQALGNAQGPASARSYVIPGQALRRGENVIALRVLDVGNRGGVTGKPDELSLRANGDESGKTISLAGAWQYKATVKLGPGVTAPPVLSPTNPNQSSVLYNGMIAPLLPYGIKGAIWYQGESNAGRPTQYRTLLPTMINDWRGRFGVGQFPFLAVQLANFMKVEPEPQESNWAALREAQYLAAKNDPNTGMACIIDLGEADDIHPRNKQDVGKRLALAARAKMGEKLVFSGPTYRSMEQRQDGLHVSFDNVGGGLRAQGGGELRGFSIAGQDGKFVWASAKIDGDKVIVSSPQVAEPLSVRYGWANNPICNLYNKEGLPAVPFRTDVAHSAMPEGFTALFDGKSLAGWRQINGTAVYDVHHGMIIGTTNLGSPNSFLCTEKRYGDFELQFEVKLLNDELNSGVQFRSNSYANYNDFRVHGYQTEIATDGTAGYIYDEARRGRWLNVENNQPRLTEAFRKGEWNHYRVVCVGDRIRTWINNQPIADVTDDMTREGFIGLQVHGVSGDPKWRVAWRNIWLKEIAPAGKKLSLYNGKNLEGWQFKPGGWVVDAEGNMSLNAKGGDIWTANSYGDFELSCEFKTSSKCNSGVFFRADPKDPVQAGFEIQVADSFGRNPPGKHDCGSLYDAVAPRLNMTKPVGEWNQAIVSAHGPHVRVWMNGEKIVDANLDQWATAEQNPDGSKNKFKRPLKDFARSGQIGFQDHGHPVWYRNVTVSDL